MSTDKTVERKAETKNSISRLVFVAISILLEIGVFVIIITKLNEYAQWINVCTRIFALILVLVISANSSNVTPYNSHKNLAISIICIGPFFCPR